MPAVVALVVGFGETWVESQGDKPLSARACVDACVRSELKQAKRALRPRGGWKEERRGHFDVEPPD